MSDITDVVDHRRVFCLNEKRDSPHKYLFDEESVTVMESDGDTTMLLYMPLRSPMRVTHILIQAPNGSVQPTVVKLYVNKVISISDIEYVPPAKEVVLGRDYTKADMEAGLMVPLSSKFSSSTSIAVVFENTTEGATKTSVAQVRLFGVPAPTEASYYVARRGC